MSVTNDLRIRRFILAGIMLAVCLGLSFQGVGGGTVSIGGCNSPASLIQCGTTTCTLNQLGPPYFCSATVTFNPAFTNIPSYVSAQWAGCNTASCHFETFTAIPIASLTMQSDNGETWANMPAASTEIYGTHAHEASMLIQTGITSAYFSVLCIQGSISATATLRPQYSTDGGNTWNELSATTGLLDASVDASDCSFTTSGVEPITVGPAGILPALAGMLTQFRIVGFNGNGLGDNVIFNNIQIILAIQMSNPFWTCVNGVANQACPTFGPAPSKTGMTITVESMVVPGTWSQGMNWIAIE